ncbi:hypothetical protein KAFR_0G03790 [Kazachstania africana CBS 2517]|uniref:AP-1 accessory protein LAA1 n=1 Tax=Kazachstania africana (strain ATCC 22294 / BCRC 22015 / CBS 2517 / CECT 1963 / NBRC 1671 / NRRL Y-8276) TaxID=1071382 RepID=H2AYG2_KAZAF|nr:hypothetical protein KAFR_0G03790 [Kazachstania africana CBS 2517]CCF59412.1 hypothetical protein KAFR_0G03790 [Kazachstania africana CBS 2517]
MTLRQTIDSSEDRRNELLLWVMKKLDRILTDETESSEQECAKIYSELDDFMRYCASLSTSELESHYISIRISKLYSVLLTKLAPNSPGKLFDTAELMTYILCEEEVSKEEQEGEKSKKKSKSSNKTYTYSAAKDLAATILIELFEVFGDDISSLGPLIFSVIFKNLKKTNEKSKYHHATYMVTLLQLFNSILRGCGETILDSASAAKFSKLSKIIFEDMYNKEKEYPVDFISLIMDSWAIAFRQESLVKDHLDDLSSFIYTKLCEGKLGIYCFSNDTTRIHAAKTISEVLYFYYSKKLLQFDDAINFYVRMFSNAGARDLKTGCVESLINFITLCYASDSSFLNGCNYLYVITTLSDIFTEHRTKHKRISSITRDLEYINYVHDLILPHITESSKSQILLQLLNLRPNHTPQSGRKILNVDTSSNHWIMLLQLDLINKLINSLSTSFSDDETIILNAKSQLIRLATSENYIIRIHSNVVLKSFIKQYPRFLSKILHDSLEILSTKFNDTEDFNFSNLHGHTFIIANLIDLATKDFVSYELVMRITVFATAFIKNNTTSTASNSYFKGLICWILLTGLMNYKDDEYLDGQMSQLFLFWKVLLNHTFKYSDDEVLLKNLELRTHALTCLLNYLNNATIDADTAKQVSYLLTKCSNFNHSIMLKSASIDKALLSNENRILQVYLKIQKLLKQEFNSSLLILLTKNFTNPNLYIEDSQSTLETMKSKLKKGRSKDEFDEELVVDTTIDTLLRLNSDFAYGISSKISSNGIVNLSYNISHKVHSGITGIWPENEKYWFSGLESEVCRPISRVLTYDSLVLLFGDKSYAGGSEYLPKVTTSLIDFSMELFSSIFPYLNSNIQYSVIENLKLSLFSKSTSKFRSVAIAANVCAALHNSLKLLEQGSLWLEASVGNLILDTIKQVGFQNDIYITNLKADIVGLTCAAIVKRLEASNKARFIEEQVSVLTKAIVDKEEPFSRVLNALSLVAIYKYNSRACKFDTIFEVIIALINDPHPIVHSWALRGLLILLDKHLVINVATISQIITKTNELLLDQTYGIFGASTLRYNYNKQFNSHSILIGILKILTEKMGPNYSDLSEKEMNTFKAIILSSLVSANICDNVSSLKIYETLCTFKLDKIFHHRVFISAAEKIIEGALLPLIGVSGTNPFFITGKIPFPQTASLESAFACFSLFIQLFKLGRGETFKDSMEILSWRYLCIYPFSPEIREYFEEWLLHSTTKGTWIDKLHKMYDTPMEKVFKGYFNSIQSQLMSKDANRPLKEETFAEEQIAITEPNTSSSSSTDTSSFDYLQWQSKEIILKLILKLCFESHIDPTLYSQLASKIDSLVKISFRAAVCNIEILKTLGLKTLDQILRLFSVLKDSENPEKSILESQEAQISSSLMSAFFIGSSPNVMVMAINISSEVLTNNLMPSISSSRISQLLIKLLENLNHDEGCITIGEAQVTAKRAIRKIQLAVLNSWARLIEYSISNDNKEIIMFSTKYWTTLIPLWIVSLREFMMITHGARARKQINDSNKDENLPESKRSEMELYEPVWLNFVKVLGAILQTDAKKISDYLDKEELESFSFVLVAKCFDIISKETENTSKVVEVLSALHGIEQNNILLNVLLSETINSEVISILDRLITTGTYKEKLIVIDILSDTISSYSSIRSSQEDFLKDIDKLYELLRLLILIISGLLPFIRYDLDENSSTVVDLSSENITLLKKAIKAVERNINLFDKMFKNDLYSCLLFIIGKIYNSNVHNAVIPVVLSLLKSIVSDLMSDPNTKSLINVFYRSIRGAMFKKDMNHENTIATFLLLLNGGFNKFKLSDLTVFAKLLITNLNSPSNEMLCKRGFENLVKNYDNSVYYQAMIKLIIKEFFDIEVESISSVQLEVALRFFVEYTGLISESAPCKLKSLYLLYLFFIAKFKKLIEKTSMTCKENIERVYLFNSEVFKEAIKLIMTTDKKEEIRELIIEASLDNNTQTSSLELKEFI